MGLKEHLYIHVIESPSSDDLLINRREGDLVCGALKLMGIKSQYLLAANRDALNKAFLLAVISHNNLEFPIPIIHLSAHGSSQGIELTSGERISWNELGKTLALINKAINGNLLLFMSTCEGLHACSMAFEKGGDWPFYALIANSAKPDWSETLVFFTTIYHLLGKGTNIIDAVEVAKKASGNQNFDMIKASDVKVVWELNELLKNENVKKYIEELHQILETLPSAVS